jgi:hypothetical protein
LLTTSNPDRQNLQPKGPPSSLPGSWYAIITKEVGATAQLSSSLPGSKALAPCSQFWRGLLCMPLCFWATQTVVAASGLFVGARRSKFTPYLPPHSSASRIQLAYRYYVHQVSRHNNPTITMLFTCISFRILCSFSPFNSAVKLAYKQYIHWTKKEFDVNSICNGLDYFHRNATTGTLGWMWNWNCFAAHWTFWHGRTTPASPFGY